MNEEWIDFPSVEDEMAEEWENILKYIQIQILNLDDTIKQLLESNI